MTIKSLEDLIIAFDAMKQQLDLQDTWHADLTGRLNGDALRVEHLIRELIVLEATAAKGHTSLVARISQLERKARRLDNQLAALPGMVTRLVDGERRVRALTTKAENLEPKVTALHTKVDMLNDGEHF